MITDKQRNVIHMIEGNLNIKFKGATKKEATAFINQNIEQSKQASIRFIAQMHLLNLEKSPQEESESMDDYFANGWYNMPH